VQHTIGARGNGLSSPEVMSGHVLTCPRNRGSTPGMTCHSVRPWGPTSLRRVQPNPFPRGRAKRSSPLGSGEAEPMPSGSGVAGLNFWRLGKVACALLLGLVLGRWCPSSCWVVCGHAITSIKIRLGRILWPCDNLD
jgi:hypothetical protein